MLYLIRSKFMVIIDITLSPAILEPDPPALV